MIHRNPNRRKRRGVILVVVVALLGLFAVVGLGYVMYADSAASVSRMSRDKEIAVSERADVDPETLEAKALGGIIYDYLDDATGVYSALRGSSLARNMYGWNYRDSDGNSTGFTPELITTTPPSRTVNNYNTVAFNGLGRLHYQDFATKLDGYDILNYVPSRTDAYITDPERYPVKDTNVSFYRKIANINKPEPPSLQNYFGGFNVPYTYPDNNNVFLGAVRASDGKVLIPSFHRPYLFTVGGIPTNPMDPNFLADRNHPDWYRPAGRKKLLRPRPIDQMTQAQFTAAGLTYPVPANPSAAQITQYSNAVQALINQGKIMPYPTDAGGDVKNLLGTQSGNDSVWMDIGMPTYSTASGKKYKPLFAFLIVDLDGRINLNVAGNVRGFDSTQAFNQFTPMHASNQGIGRHEINISKVLNMDEYLQTTLGAVNYPAVAGQMPDWTNAFLGQPSYPTLPVAITGRYDGHTDAPPGALSTIVPQPYSPGTDPFLMQYGNTPDSSFYNSPYFLMDTDASGGLGRTPNLVNRPGGLTYSAAEPLTLSAFPSFSSASGYYASTTGYQVDNGYDGDSMLERSGHPLAFNPLRPVQNMHTLDGQEMHKLIGRYDSPLDFADSTLARLMPKNFARNLSDFSNNTLQYTTATAHARQIRHMITMASADVGKPGLQANLLTPTAGQYKLNAAALPGDVSKTFPAAMQGEAFDTIFDMTIPGSNSVQSAANAKNDYEGNAYTQFLSAGATPGKANPFALTFDGRARIATELSRLDLNRPMRPYPDLVISNAGNYYDTANPLMNQRVQDANDDRQHLAEDIFVRLCRAVGAVDIAHPNVAVTTSDEYKTLQWLAQLSANIVDYIDEDDVMTSFQWIKPAPGPVADYTVFGVEMPKIVLNEAYVELTNGNESTSTAASPPTGTSGTYLWQLPSPTVPNPNPKRAGKYQVNMFVELHNTMVPPIVNNPAGTSEQISAYGKFIQRYTEWLANGPAGAKYSAYRLSVVTTATPPTVTAAAANPVLDVDFATAATAQEQAIAPVDTGAATSSYKNATGVKNGGFYVIRPDWLAGNTPVNPNAHKYTTEASFKGQALTYDIPTADIAGDPSAPGVTLTAAKMPKLVLQRLVDPHRAPNFAPGANYNPYITVDQMLLPPTTIGGQRVVNPMITYAATGAASSTSPNGRKSVCRRQPFAGTADMNLSNKELVPCPYTPPVPTEVAHCFFSHNASTGPTAPPASVPEATANGLERFDWFVHLDRKLISPIELFHVSAVPPWDVTQKFISADPTDAAMPATIPVKHGHTARWTDQNLTAAPPVNVPSTRLYRALEYFRVGDRTADIDPTGTFAGAQLGQMAFGGRDIGKVNINTIWDKEVFDAVFDAIKTTGNTYSSNLGFTQKDVDVAWNAMMSASVDANAARTRNYSTPGTYAQIGKNDRPFKGLGVPHMVAAPGSFNQYQTGAGIDDTILRKINPATVGADKNRKLMFDAESQFTFTGGNTAPLVPHPFLEKSMLTKAFDHFTTRSNVFAVYMTVGFFEVVDDSAKPDLLGNEMGIVLDATGVVVENKSIRHRMFAIVDRTNLSLQPAQFDGTKIVAEDQLKQGPAPFYYSSAVQPMVPVNSGQWVIRMPYESMQSIGAANTKMITGRYNGMSWSLSPFIAATATSAAVPGSVLYLGTGREQRRLVVLSISDSLVYPGAMADVVVGVPGAANLGAIPTAWETPPATTWANPAYWNPTTDPPAGSVLITNAIPGNPGPQPDFDHRNPRYQGVVIYSAVLE